MIPPPQPSYRPLPTGARVLLHLVSLLLALLHVALATALTLALHRFAPRLDPKLRLHLSPFLVASTLALWAFLIGPLF
ncbi:hypothetical protein F8S09_15065 [Deinococcus sp. SDU3-2]|uniref:Uncharacterized protein n=1 Tax=Deinococcus terrestris TaxID=2651870 RepID=A0A7X1NY63_9DEIO|nr:hypothetical protein [Deinococcus terrestris]MPY67980.1 hypothetical protein [Deinococcus terrestris]